VLGIALCAALAAAPTPSSRVVEVRVGNHPTFTRVVFELDARSGYRIERSESELVVTLDAASPQRRVESGGPLVTAVSVEPGDDGAVARVRLRRAPSLVKEMLLANPPRIVLDLMLPEPVAAKAARKPAETPAATPAVAEKPAPEIAATPTPKPEAAGPADAAKPTAKPALAEKPAPAPERALAARPTPTPSPKPEAAEPASARQPTAKPELAEKPAPAPKPALAEAPSAPAPAVAPERPAAAAPKPLVAAKEPAPAPGLAKAPAEPTPPGVREPVEARAPREPAPPPVAQEPAAGPKPPTALREPRRAPEPPAPLPTREPEGPAGFDWTAWSSRLAGPDSLLPLGVVAAAVVVFGVVVARVMRRRARPAALDVPEIAREVGAEPLASGDAAEVLAGFGRRTDEPERAPEPALPIAGPGLFDDEAEKEAEMEMGAGLSGGHEAMTRPAAMTPSAHGGAEPDALVERLEQRMTQLESRLEEANAARERLERQVAAQSEELRVQRAAIARTQRALRGMTRGGEDQATEPALRDPSKPSPGRGSA